MMPEELEDMEQDKCEKIATVALTEQELMMQEDIQNSIISESRFFTNANEVMHIVDRFFTVLMMSNVSPYALFKSLEHKDVEMEELEMAFSTNTPPIRLHEIEKKAFRSSFLLDSTNKPSDSIHIDPLIRHAGKLAFQVELTEYQLRLAVSTRAKVKSKDKQDVQKMVRKITSHLSSSTISSQDFELLLVEKLGLKPGRLIAKIVFSRILGRPFQRSFPRVIEVGKAFFLEAFEEFSSKKPLSLDCVEGQFRHLVSKYKNLREAFQKFDKDGSGTISMEEFIRLLQEEGKMDFPHEVLRDFIKRFDTDGDGMLNYDEFVDFARPIPFGINVLSPFGMFHLNLRRDSDMASVVQTIETRLFWLQHNDMFSCTEASATSVPSSMSQRHKRATHARKAPAKLKVSSRFIMSHQFGTKRLIFQKSDHVGDLLQNGELVVLLYEDAASCSAGMTDQLPRFEYRLKPITKRAIPLLHSERLLLEEEQPNPSTTLDKCRPQGADDSHTLTKPPGALKSKRAAIQKLQGVSALLGRPRPQSIDRETQSSPMSSCNQGKSKSVGRKPVTYTPTPLELTLRVEPQPGVKDQLQQPTELVHPLQDQSPPRNTVEQEEETFEEPPMDYADRMSSDSDDEDEEEEDPPPAYDDVCSQYEADPPPYNSS